MLGRFEANRMIERGEVVQNVQPNEACISSYRKIYRFDGLWTRAVHELR
jgi:hypothetical protein